jgi:hypothetical protein
MSVHTCSTCHSNGNVIEQKRNLVIIECPLCSKRWKTESKTCPVCSKPNGYTVEGPCRDCYSDNFGRGGY